MENLKKLNKRLAAEKLSLQDFADEPDMIVLISADIKAIQAKIKGYMSWHQRIIKNNITNEEILNRYRSVFQDIENTSQNYQKNIKIGRMLALKDAYNGDIEMDLYYNKSMDML